MTDDSTARFWDRAFREQGYTGYSDRRLHEYDQPVRLSTVGRIVDKLYPAGALLGKRVLDIGCGTGDFVSLLRERGAEVTGVDISERAIERAADRFEGDAGVTLQHGDLATIELGVGKFHLITGVTVMQHIVDEAAFAECLGALNSALHPDGRLIFLELARPGVHSREVADAAGYVYLVERSLVRWLDAFHGAGFRVTGTPAFPQLGIALLRGLNLLINGIRPRRPVSSAVFAGAGARRSQTGRTGGRRFTLGVLQNVRRLILFLSWPFDHLFHLPLPPARFCHYRVFVLSKNGVTQS